MAKGDACFHCKYQTNAHVHMIQVNGKEVPNGWSYDCALGLENEHLTENYKDGSLTGVELAMTCPSCAPMEGFQIGGYYTHMWFEEDGNCLTWVIQSDGEFPGELGESERRMKLHICDFTQMERFVEFWGKELRRRGWNDL